MRRWANEIYPQITRITQKELFNSNLVICETRMMKRNAHTILTTLARCLKLQCPVCGRASLVQRPFHVKHRCDVCGALFKREEGFFVGAIMANVVATEMFILVTYFVSAPGQVW